MATTNNNTNKVNIDGPMSVLEFDKMWMSAEKQEAIKSSTNGKGTKSKGGAKKQPKKSWKRGARPEDMPRRPLSAYNLFFKDQREAIVQERTEAERVRSGNPKIKKAKIAFEELAKTIGCLWKSIDPQLLQQYKAQADKDSKRYKAEMDAYLTKADAERSQVEPEDKKRGSSTAATTTRTTSPTSAFPFEPRPPSAGFASMQQPLEPSFLQGGFDCASASLMNTTFDEQEEEWAPLRPGGGFISQTFSSARTDSDHYLGLDFKESEDQEGQQLLQYFDPEPLPAFCSSSFPSSLFDNSLSRLLARAEHEDTMVDCSWMEPTPIRELYRHNY